VELALEQCSHKRRGLLLLSEKLNEARQKWSTYEHELYAVYRSLKTWKSYLIACNFMLYSNYQSL